MGQATETIPQYESVAEAYAAECTPLENADNYRVAQICDVEEMEDYVKAMRRGCCGSKDKVVSIAIHYEANGGTRKYYSQHLIGCNFGH